MHSRHSASGALHRRAATLRACRSCTPPSSARRCRESRRAPAASRPARSREACRPSNPAAATASPGVWGRRRGRRCRRGRERASRERRGAARGDDGFLRFVELPAGGQPPDVLGRIRVADHHFLPARRCARGTTASSSSVSRTVPARCRSRDVSNSGTDAERRGAREPPSAAARPPARPTRTRHRDHVGAERPRRQARRSSEGVEHVAHLRRRRRDPGGNERPAARELAAKELEPRRLVPVGVAARGPALT